MNSFQAHTKGHDGLTELEKILAETVKQRLLVKYEDVIVTVQALRINVSTLEPPIASKLIFTFEAQVNTKEKKEAPK